MYFIVKNKTTYFIVKNKTMYFIVKNKTKVMYVYTYFNYCKKDRWLNIWKLIGKWNTLIAYNDHFGICLVKCLKEQHGYDHK